MVYLLANGLLAVAWLVGGFLRGELGPFWPGWILLAWSVAPLLHTLNVRAVSRNSRVLQAGRRAGRYPDRADRTRRHAEGVTDDLTTTDRPSCWSRS